MPEIDFPEALLRQSPVRVLFGAGAMNRIRETELLRGARHVLLVTDAAIRRAGHVDAALHCLGASGTRVSTFDGALPNPTTDCVSRGVELALAAAQPIDCIIGLGGGSAMDCAKGINLMLTLGGEMSAYRGDPAPAALAQRAPLLPMILIPTTAGTGSEAQSFALISDARTHMKMACGDRRLPTQGGLRPRIAILDPGLTATQPERVAIATGLDALSHAIETAGCRVRTDISRAFSVAAWERLSTSFERAIGSPDDSAARGAMLLGAHLAGCAIETSMLGAAHACANPLTARFDVVHGFAVSVMLPHVIRFNAADGQNPYSDLGADAEQLARRVERWLDSTGTAPRLRAHGVREDALQRLAGEAATQWTAGFNPRPTSERDLFSLYSAAF